MHNSRATQAQSHHNYQHHYHQQQQQQHLPVNPRHYQQQQQQQQRHSLSPSSHYQHNHHNSDHLHLQPSGQHSIRKHHHHHHYQHAATAQSLFGGQQQLGEQPFATQRQRLVSAIANTADCVLAAAGSDRSGLSSPAALEPLGDVAADQMIVEADCEEPHCSASGPLLPVPQTAPYITQQRQPTSPVKLIRLETTTTHHQQQQDLNGECAQQSATMVATPSAAAPQQHFGRARVSSISTPVAISASHQQQNFQLQTASHQSAHHFGTITRSTSFSASTRPQAGELLALRSAVVGSPRQQQQPQPLCSSHQCLGGVSGCSSASVSNDLSRSTASMSATLGQQCYQPIHSPASSINSASPLTSGPLTPLQPQQQQQQQQLVAPGASYASSQQSSSSPGCGGGGATGAGLMYVGGAGHQSMSMSPSDALNLGINLEQYISKRNERERSRVRNVNDALDNLKNSLPLDGKQLRKRMSKVEILRSAIGYIRNLEDILGHTAQQQQEQQQQHHHHHHNHQFHNHLNQNRDHCGQQHEDQNPDQQQQQQRQ